MGKTCFIGPFYDVLRTFFLHFLDELNFFFFEIPFDEDRVREQQEK